MSSDAKFAASKAVKSTAKRQAMSFTFSEILCKIFSKSKETCEFDGYNTPEKKLKNFFKQEKNLPNGLSH